MTIDKLVKDALWSHPERWKLDNAGRFLTYSHVTLVRPLISERWSYIVPGLGQVPLSKTTDLLIRWSIRLRKITQEEGE